MHSYYIQVDIWQLYTHWNLTNTTQIPENFYDINFIASLFQPEFSLKIYLFTL